MKLLGFVERVADPVTQTVAPHQGSSQKPPNNSESCWSNCLVSRGGRGLVGKHSSSGRDSSGTLTRRGHLFLETFVWNNVDAVMSDVPGTIPHPEYGGYGWVRLPIDSEDAVSRARQLIETTYSYLRTTRRVSISREEFRPETLGLLGTELPEIKVKVKESKKRNQIILEARGQSDYEKADDLFDRAIRILKGSRNKVLSGS